MEMIQKVIVAIFLKENNLTNIIMNKTKILQTILLLCIAHFAYPQTGNTNTGTGAGNSGTFNTSIGYYAGDIVTYSNNTFVGANAGKNGSTIGLSTFVGSNAGYSSTSGNGNTFIGGYSGYSNATGTENTYLGNSSGRTQNNGQNNIYIGVNSANKDKWKQKYIFRILYR